MFISGEFFEESEKGEEEEEEVGHQVKLSKEEEQRSDYPDKH